MGSTSCANRSLLQCLNAFKKRSAEDPDRAGKLPKPADVNAFVPKRQLLADHQAEQPASEETCALPERQPAPQDNAAVLRHAEAGSEAGGANAQPLPEAEATMSGLPGASKVLPEKGFYSSWRAGRAGYVERTVLRLLSAARRRVGRDASAETPYQTFPLQQPAFEWADAQPNASELRVFSVEKGPEGKRSFIVTSSAKFWERYSDMLPQHRHFYEIIRERRPCHLYFDLEYPVALNAGVDGDALVETTLQLCALELKAKFGLVFSESWVVELDSSTPSKFSRHVIVNIPGAAFQSNAHVGAFVKDMVCAGQAAAEPGSQLDNERPCPQLLVKKDEEGGRTLFIDCSVYSRNRAFRLFLSSKAGKTAVLQPTGRYQGPKLSHKGLFFQSLICNVAEGARLLQCFDDADGARFSWVSRVGASGGAAAEGCLDGCSQAHVGPSHYPDIEAFITSMCTQGGVQGRVRSWVATPPETGLLLLNMRDNRWCGNVGRPHRSNGVFYVVDLLGGTWHQKCFDPECRAYRSPIMPLPAGILAALHAQRQERVHQELCQAVCHGGGAAGEGAGTLGVLAGVPEDAACEAACLAALERQEARRFGDGACDPGGLLDSVGACAAHDNTASDRPAFDVQC